MTVHRYALPDLGEGVAEGEVIEWLVEPGQRVAADDPIAEVATDKANVVIPSPVSGVVAALCVAPGEVVAVGTVLAEIATDDAERADRDSAGAVGEGSSAPTPPESGPSGSVRDLAVRLGVDLATLSPRNPDGRLTASDVRAAARPRSSRPDGRRTIARRLSAAAALPVVTNVDRADFEAVRATGTAPLVALARSTVVALGEHPRLNAWTGEHGELREHQRVHLGIATQTERGLVVPVVREADRMSTDRLAGAIGEVIRAAREGRARPEHLRGSTFTVTSAGRRAGLMATPLLNLPEVGILGLYRIAPEPVVRDGEIVVRHTANLSISFDHRAIDGIVAAEFLARVIELIEAWPSAALSTPQTLDRG